MGLGAYPEVTLAEARQRAADARKLTREGIDPIEAKKLKTAAEAPVNVPTFAEIAAEYIEAHNVKWKSDKSAARWERFERYATAAFGEKEVVAIDTDDVLKLLKPIWTTKAETANKLREWLVGVFDAAKAKSKGKAWRFSSEWENPATWKGNLKSWLPARNKKTTVMHFAALPWQEIPAFMTDLRNRDALAARALEITVLTACRTSDVLEAERSEISDTVWTIPAHRHKMGKRTGKPHRVPLSRQAAKIIATLPVVMDSPYLFPGQKRGRPLSNMSMLMLLGRMGVRYQITVHGFRSAFRDWAAEETNYSRAVCEACVAHSVAENETEASYLRSDLFEKRVELMQIWADFCCSEEVSGNVIPTRTESM